MFNLAIDSKLRGCDLVGLQIGEVVVNATVRQRATTIQQKTEKPVQFELTEQTRDSLLAWLIHRGGSLDDYVFPSRTTTGKHLSTRQYARLVGEWVEAVGLGRSAYGTHSLRRTKVALIYKRTGNLRAVQILLGHTKLESTVRYLGVDAEDALIPDLADQNPCAQSRSPMDMMRHGWSTSLLQAWQQWSTMAS